MGYCTFFWLISISAYAQNIVAGKVVSSKDNTPLSGVTVTVKNTNLGSITDSEGKFVLNISEGTEVLVFSYVGFQTHEEIIAGRNIVDITLKPAVLVLSEVVVTGTGVATEKRKLAFAVETIVSEYLPISPTASIDQALVGRIPGAQISSVVGTPGSEMGILLRGINSLNRSTMPMILVDGIQMAATLISAIDPNSIEKIEVIQGAAAATIYGAQGANGVIQLFTKKGKSGNLKVEFSVGLANNEFLNVGGLRKASLHGFATNANNEVINPGNGVALVQDSSTLLYNGNVGYFPLRDTTRVTKSYGQNLKYFDHFKVFFRPAYIYNSRLGISGGSDRSDFSISISKTRHESNFKGDGYNDRTNLHLNYGIELTKGLRIRSSTHLINHYNTIDISEKQDFGYNVNTFDFLNSRPFADFEKKDSDGNYGYYYGSAAGPNHNNPFYRYQYSSTEDKKIDLMQNFNVLYAITKNFDIDLLYGINHQTREVRYEAQNQTLNHNSEASRKWISVNNAMDNTGEITRYNNNKTFKNFKATGFIHLDFNKDFGLEIPLRSSTQVAYDYRNDQLNQIQSYALGMPSVPPVSASLGTTFNIPVDYKEKFVTFGYLLNQRFEYGDVGGVSAGFRSDYSSAFGKGSKPFTFPRADGFIRISALNFWNNSTITSAILEWKVRAAYGEAGIQPRPFDRYVTLSSKALGTSNAFYFAPNQSNPELEVEVSKEFETGTDLIFQGLTGNWLSNLQLSFSYWTRKTNNAIARVDAPPSSGLGTVLDNALSLESHGTQVSVSGGMLKNKRLAWSMTINMSTQHSIISKVKGGEIISGNRILKEGVAAGEYYGNLLLKSVGQKGADGKPFIADSLQANYELASNGWVVNKTSKQPFITPDRYSLGDPNPDLMMTFINDFSFKQFLSFSFQVDWLSGLKLYNYTRQWMYRDGIHPDYEKPITINGETGAWSAFYRGTYDFTYGFEKNYFLEDASFIRLRNVSIGLDFTRLFDINKLSKLQLVLSGRNLWTRTKYTGMDPEISSWDNESVWYGANTPLYRGVDDSTLPNFRTYQITFNVGI